MSKRTFRVRYGEKEWSHQKRHALRVHLRNQAYDRQGGLCYWCKTPMLRKAKKKLPHSVTLEHLIPEHMGGPDTPENCVAACSQCNNERGGALTPPFSYRFSPKDAA